MENKLSQFEQMMQNFKDLKGVSPRETALDDQGLGYIGRPIEQIEEVQVSNDQLPIENIDNSEIPQELNSINLEPSSLNQEPPSLNLELSDLPIIKKEEVPLDFLNIASRDLSSENVNLSPSEKLLAEYKKAQQENIDALNNAAEMDRKSQLYQTIGGSLGKALTYSSAAGGKFMSAPIPLEFSKIDPKYLEQAKLTGNAKLSGLKEQLDSLKEQSLTPYQVEMLKQDKAKLALAEKEAGSMTPYQKANLDLEKYKIDAQLKANSGKKDESAIKRDEQKEKILFDTWNNNPTTKSSQLVATAYEKVKSAANDPSGAGDLSLIFGYMKMLDPGSTVREGEFATAENTVGIADSVRNRYNKAISGERLNSEQRADFVNQAKNVYSSQLAQQKRWDDTIKARSSKSGVNPENVIFSNDLFGEDYDSKNKSKQPEIPNSGPSDSERQKALDWASKNPDAPQAKAILQKFGK